MPNLFISFDDEDFNTENFLLKCNSALNILSGEDLNKTMIEKNGIQKNTQTLQFFKAFKAISLDDVLRYFGNKLI